MFNFGTMVSGTVIMIEIENLINDMAYVDIDGSDIDGEIHRYELGNVNLGDELKFSVVGFNVYTHQYKLALCDTICENMSYRNKIYRVTVYDNGRAIHTIGKMCGDMLSETCDGDTEIVGLWSTPYGILADMNRWFLPEWGTYYKESKGGKRARKLARRFRMEPIRFAPPEDDELPF